MRRSQFHDGHLKPGEVILINGIPTGDRFEIDFIDRHGNILFHLNPRLHEKKPYSIQIFINGKRFGTFAHRTADPKHDYHAIRCAGDFELTGLEISAPHGQTYEY
ncbi:Galectin [Aphelenchoides fujianensis]|nr:Galectin [Aphelenchoides fujianensis]